MQSAILSLLGFLVSRSIWHGISSYRAKSKLLDLLLYEVRETQRQLKDNHSRLANTQTGFPLLTPIDTEIHDSHRERFVLDAELSKLAVKFLGNCKHYNRISDLAMQAAGSTTPNGNHLSKRRNEVSNQGLLISNDPVTLYVTAQGAISTNPSGSQPHSGYSDLYKKKLEEIIRRRKTWNHFLPWISILFAPFFARHENQ